jgi:hypothetical protein
MPLMLFVAPGEYMPLISFVASLSALQSVRDTLEARELRIKSGKYQGRRGILLSPRTRIYVYMHTCVHTAVSQSFVSFASDKPVFFTALAVNLPGLSTSPGCQPPRAVNLPGLSTSPGCQPPRAVNKLWTSM